jgi:hypothetical protein
MEENVERMLVAIGLGRMKVLPWRGGIKERRIPGLEGAICEPFYTKTWL